MFVIPVLLITLIWALAATALLIKNPFPFPDRGHRLFSVSDDRARQVVTSIFADAGLKPHLRFRIGSSDQTLFSDSTTVLHCLGDRRGGLTGNGLSLVVSDPTAAAASAIRLLRAEGFNAYEIRMPKIEVSPEQLAIVGSDAFRDWALVFRQHKLRMPRPEFVRVLDTVGSQSKGSTMR
jgi:hypothetical protein